MSDKITGVILAGGLGRRMGNIDKGLQVLRGQPMVHWVVERLAPQVDELLINANQNGERYAAFGYPVLADRIPEFAGPLAGRILIIDDVITAGTSVRESVEIIRAAGATPAAVVIALDRQERGQDARSAVDEVRETFGIPVYSILTLADLITYLDEAANGANDEALAQAMRDYRAAYGI